MNQDTAAKRETTNLLRFGATNPFGSLQIQEKIRQTNLRKYGFDHPMKNEEIRSKQSQSASSGLMSGVEKRFEDLTIPNVVFTGYGGRVVHSKRVVHKMGKKMTELCPDFMIFADSQWQEAQAASDIRVPMKGLSSRFVIEIFGNYYHSQSITGVPPNIHEQEVKDAYASAGIECVVLWEKDVLENWEEIKGSVEDWIGKAVIAMNTGRTCSPVSTDPEILRSLVSAEYWRTLDDDHKKHVVDGLVETYQRMDFPMPTDYDSREDFRKFQLWASKSSPKPTRFGLDCCRRYVSSLFRASVKGSRSLYDIWHDVGLMRHCIEWQLTNETGRHTSKRFLDAMCFKVGFRVVSNLHPSKVVQWLRRYSNPRKGGIFFDPCAGWGSRMLAAHVLGMKYVGIDANKKLIEELTQMAKDLQIDAELYHGDSSDAVLVERAMRGRKAEVVFTSPPYFDKEHYSEDKEQSIIMFPERDEWERKFCKAMVSNAVSVLAPASVIILNIDTDLNMCNLYSQGWNIKEIDVLMENSRTQHVERLVFISTGVLGDLVDESNLYVVCRQCGRKCQKLSEHIRKAHRMSKEEYLLKYPEMPMVSQKMSDLISASSPTEKGGYTKHIAYRCPDGKVVGKKDAWERAWGTDTPPIDSIVDGSLFDPWAGKIAGIDYVICTVCGYKSANLSRHIKREHSGVEYIGEAKSKRCIENLSLAAQKSWDIRGRTEPRDSSLNKTHKKHGLTKEMLEQLYVVAGLSDAKIGERYGMSGEGISYQRKKFGIATRSRREKCFADYSE